LQKEVAVKDPIYWKKGEQKNPQRLMRALEVKLGTGSSINNFQNKKAVERPFQMVKIGLELPREELYNRINTRVLNMVEDGLENEVRGLQDAAHLNALQTVGYSEWLDYFEEKITKEKVIENIQQNTRHYAKRQMTWFKRDPAVTWFNASAVEPQQVLLK
jgi:tRNA dimethylallyltransferase